MVMKNNRSMDLVLWAVLGFAALTLLGCATPRNRAPVEDRNVGTRAPVVVPAGNAPAD